MKDLKTTNALLTIIATPIVFYIIKTLSFIFIPLILSMFIAVLFLPLLRYMTKKRFPKFVSILSAVLIIASVLWIGIELVKLSSNEILSADNAFFEKAESKLVNIIVQLENVFGIDRLEGDSVLMHYVQNNTLLENFGSALDYVINIISMTSMTAFFVILLLSESINFQKLMNNTLFKIKYSSVKTFMKIEKDVITFVKVKFIISLLTGLGFSLACVFFDISFPVFWGLVAFILNFIQLLGSILSVVLLTLFALVELEPSSTLFFFILVIAAVEVILGGILEPVFMGKTFSVNIITVLVMLMLWGYIWGIPGMIMSIPITVVVKIILEQFPKTKIIANLMTGSERIIAPRWKIGFRKQTV